MPGPWYFSWAGGAIQEQTTVVTNGNTHGGIVGTVPLVGDTVGAQVINLASTSQLTEGDLYELEGPGIAADTYFIYDSSDLAGAPGSLALTRAVSGGARSVNLKANHAIVVAEIPCTVSNNSNVVILPSDIDLPPGVYAIRGTGIGLVHFDPIYSGATVGSQPRYITVNSAYFVYDGSSTAVTMQYQVADPHYTDGLDSFGQPTQIVTYLVHAKPCYATTSGQFAFLITGMPDADWYSVTNIPDGVLASLQTGLRYNITGNGLQNGTTFVAPAGGRSIELDQAATASQINSILTITGPRTPDAGFDPTVHNRFDVDVLSIEIAQEEGSFATLAIRARLVNPMIGLLAIGRSLWCWLSWDQAWTPGGSATPSLVPLFNGRLVGTPKLQADEIVELEFLARPDDYISQKEGLADSLKVLPYYDPVWLATNVSPDTVLETYSALWHIDRVSLGVTASDVLQGEDGTITINEDQSFYDAFTLSYAEPPLVAVTVNGTVTWQQQATGFLDVTQRIVQAFAAQGSPFTSAFPTVPNGPYGTINNTGGLMISQGSLGLGNVNGYAHVFDTHGGGGLIACLCGGGLKDSWPSPGTSIGGGWSLTTLNGSDGYPLNYVWDALKPNGWYTPGYYTISYAGQNPYYSTTGAPTSDSDVGVYLNPYAQYSIKFPLNIYKVRMVLQYQADRRRTETITAVLAAGVQRLLSDSSGNDIESIDLSSEYVAQGVDPGGEVPIGDLASRTYFQSDRGTRSFEYLLLAARAKLRARARAVQITFATDWHTALGINCRNSVTLFDRRLPGGSATGKVRSYRLHMADGRMFGEFTLACSIGTGDPSTAQAGTNSYVADGYVEPGYQTVAGAQTMLVAGELAYETLDDFVVIDDGLNLRNMTITNAVNECVVLNGLTTQVDKLKPFQNTVTPSLGDPLNVVRTFSTSVTLDMKPVAGAEFTTGFFPAVSPLALPMTIDLAADPDGITAYWDTRIGGSPWDSGGSTWDAPP